MIRSVSIPRLRATPSAAPTFAGQVLTNGVAADGLPLAGQYTAVNGPYGLGWELTAGTPGVVSTPTSTPAITAPTTPASAVSVMPSQSTRPVTVVNTLAPTPMPAQPVSTASAGSLLTTADIETVADLMLTYGDTSDNAQTIVNKLYAAGVAPGSVTDAIALPYLTGIGTTTAATSSGVVLSDPSTWPWYYWAIAAGGAYVLLARKR